MGLPAEAWGPWGWHCPGSAPARGGVKAQSQAGRPPRPAMVPSALEPRPGLTPLAPRSSMGMFPWKSLSRPWEAVGAPCWWEVGLAGCPNAS